MKVGTLLNFEDSVFVFCIFTPPPFLQGGVEPPTKFSKKEVFTGSQILEGDS